MIAGHALSVWIEHGLAVYQEPVVMVSVIEVDLYQPGAIGLPFHRQGGWVPVIEIPGEVNRSCVRGNAHKINGLGHFLGRITIGGEERTFLMHLRLSFLVYLNIEAEIWQQKR